MKAGRIPSVTVNPGKQDKNVTMEQQQLIDEIIANPVIAAVRSNEQLALALKSPVRTIFLLSGSINTLADDCRRVRQSGRLSFLHIDLVEGLRPDKQGLQFVARQIRPDGVITTKPACIKWAQEQNLATVQRIFLLDSSALRDGARQAAACRPDLVEVLPGVAEKAIRLAVAAFARPLIAGGLISTREEVIAALAAGALAVSTGQSTLWRL
jgi:glycerol uptake operon antiterminator